MLALAPSLQPPAIPKTMVAAPARPVTPEAIAILCLFTLAGLVWLAVGWAVMRGGKARPLTLTPAPGAWSASPVPPELHGGGDLATVA